MGDFTLDQIADLPLDLLVGGKEVPASDGGRFDVLDPATGDVVPRSPTAPSRTRSPPSTPPTPLPPAGRRRRRGSGPRSCAGRSS